MKTNKFTPLVMAAAILMGFSSCTDPEPPVTPPATIENPIDPTELTVSSTSDVSAVLTWNGEADDYEVIINAAEAIPVAAKTYTATNLTAETQYTWKVRAVKGDLHSEWVTGQPFTTEPGPVAAPTSLAFSEVTHNSAVLTWEGETVAYEIKIGDAAATPVEGKTFTITTLSPETEYTWSVRAVYKTVASDWVDGDAFTTEAEPLEIEFPFIASKYYMGETATTSEYWIVLNSFDPYALGAAATGWQLSMDFYSTLVPKVDGNHDIPAGTYTFFASSKEPNAINMAGMTRLTQFNEGTRIQPDFAIESGSVNISGDHNEYTFEGTLKLVDGRKVIFSYVGAIAI